jgi:hypothetical protein
MARVKNTDEVGAVTKAIKEDAAKVVSMLLQEGFDLIPNNQSLPNFRRSGWGWRPIMQVVEEANRKFGLGINTDNWHYNGVKGLETDEECRRLAHSLEIMIEGEPYNKAFYRTQFPPEAGNLSDEEKRMYRAEISDVVAFIKFLRQCGGFEIW